MSGQVKRKRSSKMISGVSESSLAKLSEMKTGKPKRSRRSSDVESVATELCDEAVDVDVKDVDVEANNKVPPSDDGDGGGDGSEFVVEKVCGKKVIDGVNHYYIKWLGWDSSTNTWEPEHHLTGCKGLVAKFEKELRKTEKLNTDFFPMSGERIRLGYYLEWPKDKEPLSVEGAIKVQNTPCYLVKFKTTPEWDNDPNNVTKYNSILATSSAIRRGFPELVIKFFEKSIEWADEADVNEGDHAKVDVMMDGDEAPPRLERQDLYPRDENTG